MLANPENCDQFTCGPSECSDATLLPFLDVQLLMKAPAENPHSRVIQRHRYICFQALISHRSSCHCSVVVGCPDQKSL